MRLRPWETREVLRWCVGSLRQFDHGPSFGRAVLFTPSALAESRGWEQMPFSSLSDAKGFFRRLSHQARFHGPEGQPIGVYLPVEVDPL